MIPWKGNTTKLRICSLSKVKDNELLWSHYANGQRGVAIAVRVDNIKYETRPILYNGITQDYNFVKELVTTAFN